MERAGEGRGAPQGLLRAISAGSSGWTFALCAGVFWLSLGLLAGTQEFLSFRSSTSWASHLAAPVVAGAIWVPITVAVAALSRRYPLSPLRWTHVGIHLSGSVLVGFLLNLVFFLLEGVPAADLAGATSRAAVRWLHLNAGAYWGILAVAHWIDRRGSPDLSPDLGEPVLRDVPEPVLRVRTGRRIELVPVGAIQWIEGAGDYARIHVEGRQYLASRRLKDLEAELPDEAFARVHRSALVRLDSIRELRHRSHGDYEAVLVSGDSVRVSRRRRRELMERLERAAL